MQLSRLRQTVKILAELAFPSGTEFQVVQGNLLENPWMRS